MKKVELNLIMTEVEKNLLRALYSDMKSYRLVLDVIVRRLTMGELMEIIEEFKLGQ